MSMDQQSNLQGEPISYDQPSYIQTPVKVRSKMLFIIAGALIVILFLGGLAIGLISSNKSGTQANKNSQNAEQGDSSKTLVQNGDFDTVVTVKSKDIDNIKLFKEPGRKEKSRKSTGRSSLCAITGKNGRWRKMGQKLIFVIVRDGAGWTDFGRSLERHAIFM